MNNSNKTGEYVKKDRKAVILRAISSDINSGCWQLFC